MASSVLTVISETVTSLRWRMYLNRLNRGDLNLTFTSLVLDDEPLSYVVDAMKASRTSLRSLTLTARTCALVEAGTESDKRDFSRAVTALTGPVAVTVEAINLMAAHPFLSFERTVTVFTVAGRLLEGANVSHVNIPPVTLASWEESYGSLAEDKLIPAMIPYTRVLSDPRAKMSDAYYYGRHALGSYEGDTERDEESRLLLFTTFFRALSEKPISRWHFVNQRVHGGMELKHLTFDSDDGAQNECAQAISDRIATLRSLRVSVDVYDSETFFATLFSHAKHGYPDGVNVLMRNSVHPNTMQHITPSSVFDDAFRNIRAGKELVMRLELVRWEPSTLGALEVALTHSPELRRVQLYLWDYAPARYAPSAERGIVLTLPAHITSAEFEFESRIWPSLFAGAAFAGLTALTLTFARAFNFIHAIEELRPCLICAVDGAPALRQLILRQDSRGGASKTWIRADLTITCPAEWAGNLIGAI